MEITSLPNIGKSLAESLKMLDICTAESLQGCKSEDVFLKLKTIDPSACINRLFAIEGAIQNIRWHNISEERKNELLEFYNHLKNKIK